MEGERNNEQEAEPRGGADGGDASEGPRRKRRRRRGRRKGSGPEARAGEGSPAAEVAPTSEGPAPEAAPNDAAAPWQALAAGLFSHLDERQVPCMIDGCPNTWSWTAQEQMQAFGQPPPKRMCNEHRAALSSIEDRELPCANPGCEHTWTWTTAMQRKAMQRTGGTVEPPRKVCPHCIAEEKDLADREVPCRLEGCGRHWTWTRDAQLKHRVWARRQAEEDAAEPASGRGGGKRRGRRNRRRRRPDIHEPPPRLCGPCQDKLARLEPREAPCKVHGCTRTVTLDREVQLRAWALLHTEDLDAEPSLPRRMCDTCREFCRSHPDREVACGRPGCERTWTYKTGAQLQDFLAGRRQDPIRLCDECSKGGALLVDVESVAGMEVMPCVVPLCDGVWFYREGLVAVEPSPSDPLPLDRMCDRCRQERGAEPRARALEAELEPDPEPDDDGSDGEADDGGSDDGGSDEADDGEAAEAVADASASETEPREGIGMAAEVEEAGAANEATAANEAVAANEPGGTEPSPSDEP